MVRSDRERARRLRNDSLSLAVLATMSTVLTLQFGTLFCLGFPAFFLTLRSYGARNDPRARHDIQCAALLALLTSLSLLWSGVLATQACPRMKARQDDDSIAAFLCRSGDKPVQRWHTVASLEWMALSFVMSTRLAYPMLDEYTNEEATTVAESDDEDSLPEPCEDGEGDIEVGAALNTNNNDTNTNTDS